MAEKAKVKDKDIRQVLHRHLKKNYKEALIVDEFVLGFEPARVDVALINDDLIGFEIKSEADTLARLEKQIKSYNKVFDYMVLVVSDKHVDEALLALLPAWWGIIVAENGEGLSLKAYRLAKRNPKLKACFALASLLWRDEALAALTKLGKDRGVRSKPRRVLYARMLEVMSTEEMREVVRSALKSRTDWRSKDAPSITYI